MLKNLLRSKRFVTFLLVATSPCAFRAAANQKIMTTSIPMIMAAELVSLPSKIRGLQIT